MKAGASLATDLEAGPHRAVLALIAIVLGFVLVTLVWAALAPLSVSVQARGAVIAPSRVQEVQSLEGGIVRELLVQPGQPVHKGDVLVRLDTAQYTADLGESQQGLLQLTAARTRADALLSGMAPRFDPQLEAQAPDVVREERRQWQEAQREFLAAQLGAAEAVRRQAAEIEENRSHIRALEDGLRLAQESFALEERLFKEGAGSRADYLTAQQRLQAQRGELDTLRQSMPKLEAALAGARAQAAETSARFRAQWSAQRSELEGKAASLGSAVKGKEDRVARRELVAPVDGVVNRVLIPTRGGVAAPGAPILEIVPAEAGLRINARIKPPDIGFIHVGQHAAVRVLAFDDAIYGKLSAEVERVGADVVLDENHQPYFEVELRAPHAELERHGKRMRLSPGMPTDANILTGERTVLQYLLKPLLKTFDSALQER
jgi:adhesin transport system membrane fusion protein